MSEDPPGYNEGPPADRTEVERAARHVERLARKNEPAGDTAGMRGPGDHRADRSDAADARDEGEPSEERHMTSDSDDVAETADQKPPGALKPQGPEEAPTKDEHPTGEKQAEENRENDPPA